MGGDKTKQYNETRYSKYHRLVIEIPKQQYAALTPAQQKTLSMRVRECIKEFLEERDGE